MPFKPVYSLSKAKLIATPANEWVVKLITSGQFTAINALSALNTEIGPKFWLHILFFALVLSGLWIARLMTLSKERYSLPR